MHGEDTMDALAALALGVLPADEGRRLRQQIALDPDLFAEYTALRTAAGLIGYVAEADTATLDALDCNRMKAQLLRAIRVPTPIAQAPPRARRAVVWPAWIAAAAALLFALVSALTNVSLRSDLNAARERIASLESRVTAEAKLAADERARLADLYAPDAKHFQVNGGEVVERDGRLYIAMRQLPKLPRGKVYQAWTLAAGEKHVAPSVTFTPNQNGSAIVALPPQPKPIAAVAVSVEPEGGSKSPTSTPTFVRPLS
jgi:anti-sigma-K factor RskA